VRTGTLTIDYIDTEADRQAGQEATIFTAVFVHSTALACLVGLIRTGLCLRVLRARSMTALK
jgi:hypothetical protein